MTEEVVLGDVDAIDEFCIISIFDEASQYLSSNSKIQLSTQQKLQFYALFKQATVGICNKPKPGLLEMVERAKWNAWKELGKMSKDQAIAAYVQLLDQVAPQWRDEADQQREQEDEQEQQQEKENKHKGSDDGGLHISPALSRPVQDTAPYVPDDSKDVCYWANQGNLEKVKEALTNGQTLTQYNKEGQNPLHLAVDGGHTALLSFMLSHPSSSIALNSRDSDGLTPLHFACICDRSEIAEQLLIAGADPDIVSNDGETCWDTADAPIKKAMQRAIEKRKITSNPAIS